MPRTRLWATVVMAKLSANSNPGDEAAMTALKVRN